MKKYKTLTEPNVNQGTSDVVRENPPTVKKTGKKKPVVLEVGWVA